MFTDAHSLPNNSVVEADLAIIGAGPAGITLARALAASGLKICLIESGGLELDPDVQALYEGESIGIDYPLSRSRLRFFGGSSNHWGGYTRPLDEIDFEAREWIPYSGWPFGRNELDAYYPLANEILQVAPGRYEQLDYWAEKTGEDMLELATGRLRTEFVHYSPPTRFGQRYRDELKRTPNIQVLLNANVTNIAVGSNAQMVNALAIQTLTGLSHTVKAQRYVVAAGALENARLLLLSNDVMPTGVGNQNDLVGRFFMEHPHLSGFCEIVSAEPERLPKIYRQRVRVDGRSAKVSFKPSESFLRQRRLLNATFQFGVAGEYKTSEGNPIGDASRAAAHVDMLRAARRFLADGQEPLDPQDTSYAGVWLGVGCACEQVPNPDSRVSLSNERDVLGLEKIRLDWRLTEQDRRSVVEHMHSLALEFGALGIGRAVMNVADDGRWPPQVQGGNHHMGTTRMSDDPKTGVVDGNAKVHGIDNLYVAGSSVFPTSGTANPTLTLVALALRLADHLQREKII